MHAPTRRQPTDQVTMRRSNLALVLRHVRDAGPRSRATIAAETGLNRGTVSSLVAELIERGLLREGDVRRAGSVGRPGQTVELDGRNIAGVGVEINVDYVTALALDLSGGVVFERRVALDVPALAPDAVLDAVVDLAGQALTECAARDVTAAGVTVAVPALIDNGVVAYAPNLRWTRVAVTEALSNRLGLPVRVDNDANLAALGEFAMGGAAGTLDLVYLTGETGVGGGVMVDGRLLRGAAGFSGEIGHMPLNPGGDLCGCGRRGCWETMVGLAALLRMAAAPDDPVCDPSMDLEERLAMLRERARGGEARTLDALRLVGSALGLGASILVNVFNPKVLVLGGYFASLGEYLLPPMLFELRGRVIAPDACEVALSTLGFTAAARGGAHVALEAVLDDPTLVGRE